LRFDFPKSKVTFGGTVYAERFETNMKKCFVPFSEQMAGH
jgi:hypothetical protein